MKAIREKINQERIKAVKLQEYAFYTGYKKSLDIHKEQEKAHDKFIFFKKLNEAVNKQNKEEQC